MIYQMLKTLTCDDWLSWVLIWKLAVHIKKST